MGTGTTVLMVDDDVRLAQLVRHGFERAGVAVWHAPDAQAGLRLAQDETVDVVLLDIQLPDSDGLTLLRRLREAGMTRPVLMLTGRGTVRDRVQGLRDGADDYLAKPFAFVELQARVEALLRRHERAESAPLVVGDVELDPAARTVRRDGDPVQLTPREFDLLEVFLRSPGQALSRTLLLERVWQDERDVDSNVVAVYVQALRDKVDRPFGRSSLVTVRGVGYRWERDDPRAGTAGG